MPIARLRLRIDCEAITGPGTQGTTTGMTIVPQEPQGLVQRATVVPISSSQPQAVVTTGFGGENVGTGGFPSAQDVMNVIALKFVQPVDPSNPEEFNDYIQRMKEVQQVLTTLKLENECRASPWYFMNHPGKYKRLSLFHAQ